MRIFTSVVEFFYTETYIAGLFDFSYILVQQLLQVSSMFIDFFFFVKKYPFLVIFVTGAELLAEIKFGTYAKKGVNVGL